MKEGEKLRTNEARVKKPGTKGNICKDSFQDAAFLNTGFARTILQSSYLISANSSISSQKLPSHTNKATVAGIKGGKRKKESYRRKGRMLQFFAQDTVEGNGSFFQFFGKPQNKMAEHAVSGHLMEGGNWGTGEENTWIKSCQTKCLRLINSSGLRQLL